MRLRLRRTADASGPAPEEAGPSSSSAENPSAASGSELESGRALRSFNRYEIKYLMPVVEIPRLREELGRRLKSDTHGVNGGYGVWSTYYDTRDLRFYWEKIEGLKFRRKLRVRHYGNRFDVDDDTVVHVEIKQRVNRVTQKRRVALPYGVARDLCDRRVMIEHGSSSKAFVEEVLELVTLLDLAPVMMTGYQREAFEGTEADTGLRVTFDQRVRGRDRDFHFAADAENRLIVPAHLSVVEFKANERVPYWLTDLAGRLNMSVVRVSKYCQGVEAYERAPRSIFHIPDEQPAGVPAGDAETVRSGS
ncbi:polyphosphate polymerase domain-containing protein [Kineosporia sp. J2-2]|uniref:Polyphosphate polymerase domain-containing protein n=1 Tax=Kineosporia corallincola TaxID=2835133 RepID=A0ABS5TGC3_9ACTN|nr:polyphosphate polymerase domain-containing protein [Kineosporia corallincola]MBT0770121.1 polyphosphate polymerase domain-containing protein [Kineosporia corallincola]